MKRVELYAKVRHAVRIEGLSERAAARRFGIDPRTVAKMVAFSVPPGYRRSKPPVRPKLDAFTAIIDRILAEDKSRPKKQQHTAKRIFERLRAPQAEGHQVGRRQRCSLEACLSGSAICESLHGTAQIAPSWAFVAFATGRPQMGQAHDFMRRIGKIMREGDASTQEALPKRWVDLIHYLDEKERGEERAREQRDKRQRQN